MFATLRIAQTTAGDEALALADAGALDGLSVGVDIHTYEIDTDTDVTTVTRATLREISLTPFPAFDSARVDQVNLHRTLTATSTPKGTVMPEVADTGTPTAAPAATVDVAALEARFAALLDERLSAAQAPVTPAAAPAGAPALPADFAAQIAELVADQVGVKEFAAQVNPVRANGAAQVNEPIVYRFDGRKGDHDFSSDVFAAIRDNSGEAKQRLKTFMSEVFVSKANVADLNPSRQRPDLWVDEKEFSTPLWDSIVKGTLEDSTPFILPKFNTSSGLVATHTEGVSPTPGTFTATSQTVTPTASSGRVEITREAWDQGGNPQIDTGNIAMDQTQLYLRLRFVSGVCLGSAGPYWEIGGMSWERRMDQVFEHLARDRKSVV